MSHERRSSCLDFELGVPLPNEDHACSVSMPKWQHVIQYEEGCPELRSSLGSGYPRFIIHRDVLEANSLFERRIRLEEGRNAFIFPSALVAQRCIDFLNYSDDLSNSVTSSIEMRHVGIVDAVAVVFPSEYLGKVKTFWQHTGEILSSRTAEFICTVMSLRIGRHDHSDDPIVDTKEFLCIKDSSVHVDLRSRISNLINETIDNVFLYPTGMAAIFAAHRLLTRVNGPKKSIIFGFPYLDTLKLLRRPELSVGIHFFPHSAENDYQEVERILQTEGILGIFVEFPGNPLLRSVDIRRLSKLAHQYGSYLVVDDTIGSFNINVLQNGVADIVVASLTKIFSGNGNVMGGSLVINSASQNEGLLKNMIDNDEGYIFGLDAKVLLQNSEDLTSRISQVNATADKLVNYLHDHPAVAEIFYPKYVDREVYESFSSSSSSSNNSINNSNKNPNLTTPTPTTTTTATTTSSTTTTTTTTHNLEHNTTITSSGNDTTHNQVVQPQLYDPLTDSKSPNYGPLFSMILHGDDEVASTFYDNLPLAKGPSLGTNFTLCCPYTILAHYDELQFVETCGVNRNLIRVSVGLESFEKLKKCFNQAFQSIATRRDLSSDTTQ